MLEVVLFVRVKVREQAKKIPLLILVVMAVVMVN
jgi:hypothetical protein